MRETHRKIGATLCTLLAVLLLACLSCVPSSMPRSKIMIQQLAEHGLPVPAASSLTTLQHWLRAASPGDTLTLSTMTLSHPCTLETRTAGKSPVVLQVARECTVRVTGPLRLQGNGLEIVGFRFEGKGWLEIEGSRIQVSSCIMDDSRAARWLKVLPGSREVKVQDCVFRNKGNNSDLEQGGQLMVLTVDNADERHIISSNLFENIPRGKMDNGYEAIQLITRGNPHNPGPGDCGVRIVGNRFHACNGETEIISVKVNGATIDANVFQKCEGAVVLRHGHRNTVSNNAFIGGAGGVRLQGEDHAIIGNSFQNLRWAAIQLNDGTSDSLYMKVKRALIRNNDVENCPGFIQGGVRHPAYTSGQAPEACSVESNRIQLSKPGVDPIASLDVEQLSGWSLGSNSLFETVASLKETPAGFVRQKIQPGDQDEMERKRRTLISTSGPRNQRKSD